MSPGRYLGPIWPLFTCPLESTLQTSSSHGPDKAKEPRSALHQPRREDPSTPGSPLTLSWVSRGDGNPLGMPWSLPGAVLWARVDSNRVLGDASTQHPAPAGSPSPGPNPVNTSPALSTPGAANQCPGSRQGSWVPFQEGSGRSWHPHRCLSFPRGWVHLPHTSLPDPRRWLLRRAGTCRHAGRGPRQVRARPLRCLTQAGPCLPFRLPAASKAAGTAQPLGANGSHRLLCSRHGGGTPKSP